jgi:hypothetical protein
MRRIVVTSLAAVLLAGLTAIARDTSRHSNAEPGDSVPRIAVAASQEPTPTVLHGNAVEPGPNFEVTGAQEAPRARAGNASFLEPPAASHVVPAAARTAPKGRTSNAAAEDGPGSVPTQERP